MLVKNITKTIVVVPPYTFRPGVVVNVTGGKMPEQEKADMFKGVNDFIQVRKTLVEVFPVAPQTVPEVKKPEAPEEVKVKPEVKKPDAPEEVKVKVKKAEKADVGVIVPATTETK